MRFFRFLISPFVFIYHRIYTMIHLAVVSGQLTVHAGRTMYDAATTDHVLTDAHARFIKKWRSAKNPGAEFRHLAYAAWGFYAIAAVQLILFFIYIDPLNFVAALLFSATAFVGLGYGIYTLKGLQIPGYRQFLTSLVYAPAQAFPVGMEAAIEAAEKAAKEV